MEPDKQITDSIDSTDLGNRLLRVPHRAMASVFEIYFVDLDSPVEAEQTAAAAYEEVDRAEQELSFFIPSSDVSRINSSAVGEVVKIGPDTFDCLRTAMEVYQLTQGAFDPTAGALLSGRKPWDLEEDHPCGGMSPPEPDGNMRIDLQQLLVDPQELLVARQSENIRIDLGGIGKGHALDLAQSVLDDWGIETALLNGGNSTMLPMGMPDGLRGWPMRVRDPRNNKTIGYFDVANQAVGASSDVDAPHILDPKTGKPTQRRVAAWSVAANGAEADAFSTAFMIMDESEIEACCKQHKVCALLISEDSVKRLGDWSRFNWREA